VDFLWLAAIGGVSGVVAGMLGLAGGVIVVPALTWLYGPSVLHMAIVASWFSVLFNSLGAVSKQLRMRNAQERRQLLANTKWFLLGAAIISPLVAWVANGAQQLVHKEMVGGLQALLAVMMLCPMTDGARPRAASMSYKVLDVSVGGFVGGVSTLIGVGGGAYAMAYFVYGAGVRFRDAIATANLTGLAIGTLSVIGFAISQTSLAGGGGSANPGPISWGGVGVMVLAGLVGAPFGVRLSSRVPIRTLRQIVIFVLMVSAGRLLWA
jgi:uncharacterized membrane protein YfcA